jgi:CRISPR-associated protein Csx10
VKQYTLRLELLSPALIASGEGFGSVIDTDIVFDEVGIPFIPAKRIKGCLLDSAREVKAMFGSAEIPETDMPVQLEKVFGLPGAEKSAPVFFSNLFIEDYKENQAWLQYYLSLKKGRHLQYGNILSRESILETFTEIRQQTAIDEDGVAKEHSLRTFRLARKDLVFYGDLQMEENENGLLETIVLACMNFRRMGSVRNRGFGEVRCSLLDKDNEIPIQDRLEALCIR